MPTKLWKKGESGHPEGRPPGVKNKIDKLRDCFLEAFYRDEEGHKGGVEFLVELRKKHPADFAKLVARMLPQRIEGGLDLSDAREVVINFGKEGAPSPPKPAV